jgi:hypothetical protein
MIDIYGRAQQDDAIQYYIDKVSRGDSDYDLGDEHDFCLCDGDNCHSNSLRNSDIEHCGIEQNRLGDYSDDC